MGQHSSLRRLHSSLPSLGKLTIACAAVSALSVLGAACGDDSDTGGKGGTAASSTASGTGGTGGTGADRHVVILFTSDEHSHLFAFSPELDDDETATAAGDGNLIGGVARRKAVIDSERKAADDAGKDSILVSAGDNQMGCLPHLAFESSSIDYGAMKSLGYDVTTFGNHEFDFGPGALAQSITAAKGGTGLPPIVASNVHFDDADASDDALAALYAADASDESKPVHPYRVLTTKHGVKIGVLGYVGINAAHVAPNKTPIAFSAPVDPDTDGDVQANLPALYADLQPVVDKLRNDEKVDLVVALAHGGVDDSSTAEGIAAGEDTQVCQNVSGIDFIVSGHAHNHDPKAMPMTNTASGKPCLVLNGGSFGAEVGHVEFTIPADATKGVTWDEATQKLVPVDDKTLPDVALGQQVSSLVEGIESTPTLATLLTHATGETVTNDPEDHGDLYFKPLGNLDYDITDTHALVWLSADSMLKEADDLALTEGLPATDVALDSAGLIRSVMKKGKTGVVSAADAFNVVPLGRSPADGSIGYPLIRGTVSQLELRAVLEFARAQGTVNSDYNIGFAGLKVEYDATRPFVLSIGDLFMADKGQIMKISLDTDHSDGFEQANMVLYDRVNSIDDASHLVSFVTSSYIGQFASDAGVTIKDDAGNPLALVDAIVKRADDSEVKQLEAFMGFIVTSPAGHLVDTYDTTSASFTQRWVCLAGC